jgi:hypothetical protein
MGTNHGGNSGDMPPEGDRTPDPELPELPPEWANLEIPNDLSALADEVEQIQRELAEERRTGRRPGRPTPARGGGVFRASLGTPLLIMSIAVLITLVSLFAMAWSGSSGTSRSGGQQQPASGPATLPPIALTDHTGRQVALSQQAPMAILLVEECDCQNLVAATASAAPAGVRVVAIGHGVPPAPTNLAPDATPPVRLADPSGVLRRQLELGVPTDAATVVLVTSDGRIARTYQAATSIAQFQGELAGLAPR